MDFHWRDLPTPFVRDRFPSWADGLFDWQQTFTQWTKPLSLPPLVSKRPRVFVSHRQADVTKAERIAWLANQAGFDYWLDVHDPNLKQLQTIGARTPIQQSIAIASIIEMALHNCSHVIAVMTPNTLGSAWVPYEYGRIPRASAPAAACCWTDPKTYAAGLPDYLYLNGIWVDEPAINAWLASELMIWNAHHGPSGPPLPWTRPKPPPL